jgi:hypothetical protein
MSNPFSENYIQPKTATKYFKLNDGNNLIRILSKKNEVISYFKEYVDAKNDKGEDVKKAICHLDNGDGRQPAGTKRVWAMAVYNHDADLVQVAEFTQKSVQDFLLNIARGKIKNDWTKFDIQITKTGTQLETKYSFVTGDTGELPEATQKMCTGELQKINLQAMEKAEDPFEQNPEPKKQPVETTVANELPEIEIDINSVSMPF